MKAEFEGGRLFAKLVFNSLKQTPPMNYRQNHHFIIRHSIY